MFRARGIVRLGLCVATVMLLKAAESGYTQDYCGNRGSGSGYGRDTSKGRFFGYRPGCGWGFHGEPAETEGPRLKRYVDATGRWTGDGVDTMATNPPPWKRCR